MKKSQIETHRIGYSYRSVPAINVKARNWPSVYQLEKKWPDVSVATLEKALEYAWNMAVTAFWENAREEAQRIFHERGVRVYSEGRCGGWLYVDGIDHDIAGWDAIAVSRWGRLARWCEREIAYLCSLDKIVEDIEANQWYLDGAEEYNFIDINGETHCVAELKTHD